MTDDLIARLRSVREKRSKGDKFVTSFNVTLINPDGPKAADALEAKDKRIAVLEEKLDERHKDIMTLIAEMDSNVARIAELQEALKPFAKSADGYDPNVGDDEATAMVMFKIGELRAARAALEGKDD